MKSVHRVLAMFGPVRLHAQLSGHATEFASADAGVKQMCGYAGPHLQQIYYNLTNRPLSGGQQNSTISLTDPFMTPLGKARNKPKTKQLCLSRGFPVKINKLGRFLTIKINHTSVSGDGHNNVSAR